MPTDSATPDRVGERDVRLDLGRCLAALFVVYVHHSVNYLPTYDRGDMAAWHVANLTNSIGRVSVPLFLMMSGALVLGRPIRDWGGFMRRRTAATLKPYVFGAAFYLIWQYFAQGVAPISVVSYAKSFVLGGAFFHLYFLFLLLGMYIVTPLLQGLGNIPGQALLGTTVLLFLLAIIDRHLAPFGFTLGYLGLGVCYSYLPYFLSGYVMYRFARPKRRRALIMFALCTALTTSLAWLTTANGWASATENVAQYTSINVVLQSLAAFYLLLSVDVRSKPAKRAISKLAELTLGIYILHYAVVFEIMRWFGPVLNLSLFWQMILYPLLGFAMTAVLVRILHRIPGVRGVL